MKRIKAIPMHTPFTNLLKHLWNTKIHHTKASLAETMKTELLFYVNYIQKDMVVFDVGANCGDMTVLFSNLVGKGGKVHAFEPSETTYQKLLKVIHAMNKDNVILNNLAVTDHKGSALFYMYDEKYSTWNTLAQRPLESYGIDIHPRETREVKTTTIDDYCSENNISHIDLLKIDVEGAEYQVMLGAEQMFSRHAVGCCVFEYGATTFDMGNNPGQIECFLAESGYGIHNIIPWAPVFPGRSSAREAHFSIHIAKLAHD
jgi:FkbM family methyltransferase